MLRSTQRQRQTRGRDEPYGDNKSVDIELKCSADGTEQNFRAVRHDGRARLRFSEVLIGHTPVAIHHILNPGHVRRLVHGLNQCVVVSIGEVEKLRKPVGGRDAESKANREHHLAAGNESHACRHVARRSTSTCLGCLSDNAIEQRLTGEDAKDCCQWGLFSSHLSGRLEPRYGPIFRDGRASCPKRGPQQKHGLLQNNARLSY